MTYKKSAVTAVKFANQKEVLPQEAWEQAVKLEFPHSVSSQLKSCPKNTFLGLCEAGKIKGIDVGSYTRSSLNKQ